MKSKFLLVICFYISLYTADAQNQHSDSTLTFKEAIDIALQNNVTLNTQRNNLFQNRVNKTFRMAQLGPQASISGSVYESNGNRFIPQEGKVVNATLDGAQLGLAINQPIFNGLTGLNTFRQASNQFDAQIEQVKRSTQDVINLVATQFLNVLLDQELLKIAEENLSVQKTQYNQVKTQVDLGSRSPVDQYNQLALVSTAELRVAQAEYTLANDRTTLFQTLLVDPTIKTSIVEPAWDVNAIVLDDLNLDQLLEVAADKRADLKQAQYTATASRFAMHANKGNYLPGLNAFYNNGSAYNQLKGSDKNDPGYRSFSDQFNKDNRSNSFGVALNIPIFSGFQNRAFFVQSKVLYENNKLLVKNREVLVKGDVVRAYENFQSVKKAYSAGVTGLEASKMAYGLETERYNLGVTSFVDFSNANRIFVQAQTDMAQAKYRFIFQKIMLDYAVGTLKPEDIPE
jgi:outer membrane protein